MSRPTQTLLERRYARLGLLLIAPTIVVFCAVIVYPLLAAIYLSRCSSSIPRRWKAASSASDNYRELLARGEFWTSLWNTLVWTAGTLSLQIVLGIGMALMLHQNVWFRSLARSLILFPVFRVDGGGGAGLALAVQ
jgi:multiple sugar transport system permease protein